MNLGDRPVGDSGNVETAGFIGLAADLGREFDVPMAVANLPEQTAALSINRV